MKAHINCSTKAHLIRGGFYVLLLIFFFLIRFALAQQHVVKPTGAPGAHLVPAPRSLSPQDVIYGRYNNETELPDTPVPTATATPTASATATHTPTPCGQYWTSSGTLPIVPGTTDTGNHCDECDTTVTLPFPFRLYGVTYNNVMASSSGRLDFLCNNEPFFGSVCLPAGAHNCPFDYTIFPLWSDLRTDGGFGCSAWANGCGIFTSVSGTAPNRIFNIEWHTVTSSSKNAAQDFEVCLYENDPNQRFDVIYGAVNYYGAGDLWVGGVQGPQGFFTEDFCQVMYPPPMNVSRTYTFVPCVSPTPTSTPTATATLTPPATPTPSEPGCTVIGSQPACNSTVSTEVTDFLLYVSYLINYGSVHPSDFTVNGIPADDASVAGTTVNFHFNASPAVQGENSMDLPVGAFTCQNGYFVNPFTCIFTYQPSTPTPTSPPPSPTPTATATATPTATPRATPSPRLNPTPRPRPTPPPRP